MGSLWLASTDIALQTLHESTATVTADCLMAAAFLLLKSALSHLLTIVYSSLGSLACLRALRYSFFLDVLRAVPPLHTRFTVHDLSFHSSWVYIGWLLPMCPL